MSRVVRQTVALVLFALAGCGAPPGTGPVELVWDRDVCARCQMAIGDRRFAAQIRHAHEVTLFDDLGCALLWLEERGDAADEFWVRDSAGESWIDGRRARYAAGMNTPMAYGFGTLDASGGLGLDDGGLGLDEVGRRIQGIERERRLAEG